MNELPRDVDVNVDVDAVCRAHWLAELSDALDEADQLASKLSIARIDGGDALELFMRLAAARAQLQALRLGRPDNGDDEDDPKWRNPPLWPNQPTPSARRPVAGPRRR